jgi:hypothetical protein
VILKSLQCELKLARLGGTKQINPGLNLNVKKTRKREFLEEMERVVPWQVLCEVVEPYNPKGKTGHSGLFRRSDKPSSLFGALTPRLTTCM